MNNNELIADKIEEVIGRMFAEFESSQPRACEYSIFCDPKKHASWFIIIYFADSNELREGLKNGVCYHIHSYLRNELDEVDGISKFIGRSIFFESGNRPIDQRDIDSLFGKLLGIMERLEQVAGKTDIGICGTCGHDFDKHQLFCEGQGPPTEGWMICPDENCNCFQTWGVNYNYAAEKDFQ